MKKCIKNRICALSIIVMTICIFNMCFAGTYRWYHDDQNDKWLVNDEADFQVKNQIICDDIDNDGIAYYYYIDEDGYMLRDTICPDYYVVDDMGRRLDKNGKPLTKEVVIKGDFNSVSNNTGIIADIQKQIEEAGNVTYNKIEAKSDAVISSLDGDIYGPQRLIGNDGNAHDHTTIIGKGVVFKSEDEDKGYDATIDIDAKKYVKDGNQYNKNVKGKNYTGATWENVLSLNGDGAYVDIENPSNNFNRITGRVATQYFDSNSSQKNDRTTLCTLIVYDEEENELYSTSNFNYTSSVKFNFTFPRKLNKLRFEISISGQYTSRHVYLKDLKYGFNKQAWAEEREEDEENAIIESLININRIQEVEETEWEYPEVDETEEHETVGPDEVDDDDEEEGYDPDNIKVKNDDSTKGPSFDTKLQEEAKKKAVYGPAFPNNQ